MNNYVIALLIGAAAGLIDAIPMLGRKIPVFSVAAIFCQWVLLGLVIPFIKWETEPWLTGLILGELGMLPFMIQVMYRNKKALLPMILFAGILGVAIGVAGDYFIQPEPLFDIKFSHKL